MAIIKYSTGQVIRDDESQQEMDSELRTAQRRIAARDEDLQEPQTEDDEEPDGHA